MADNKKTDAVALTVLIIGILAFVTFVCLWTDNNTENRNKVRDCSVIYVSADCNSVKKDSKETVSVFSPYEMLFEYFETLFGEKYDE